MFRLVSSDAMARGIDVPDIDCVISFDVPSASMYIHRIGRTARAGKPGKAISIVTNEEVSKHFIANITIKIASHDHLNCDQWSMRKLLLKKKYISIDLSNHTKQI